jgi:integrase
VARPFTDGVTARGKRRIQYDFMYEGVRYRPTLQHVPSERNLCLARQHLQAIKDRIMAGTFCFADEFPDFRDLKRVPSAGAARTCGQGARCLLPS